MGVPIGQMLVLARFEACNAIWVASLASKILVFSSFAAGLEIIVTRLCLVPCEQLFEVSELA
jgi:hypothetical protein